MDNLARKKQGGDIFQEWGLVVGTDGSGYQVETDTGIHSVRRAVSCLVEPEFDDVVLVSLNSLGEGFILSVLDRESKETTLAFESDVNIRAPEGRVGVMAGQGIDLTSPGEMSLLSKKIRISGKEGEVQFERMSLFSTMLESSLGAVKVLADQCESVIGYLLQKARHSFRQVDQLDQVQAGNMKYTADKSLMMRGEFSQFTAKEDIHIDGQRINIG